MCEGIQKVQKKNPKNLTSSIVTRSVDIMQLLAICVPRPLEQTEFL